jgi:hypothetical protein
VDCCDGVNVFFHVVVVALKVACWEPESAVRSPLPSRLECRYLTTIIHNIAKWWVNLGSMESPNHKAHSKLVCFSWERKTTSQEHDGRKRKSWQ